MKTITHVYDDPAIARDVVSALEEAGFTSSEVSVVKRHDENGQPIVSGDDDHDGAKTGASVGFLAGAGAGILASIGIIAIPGLGPLVAAGVLATTLTTAAAGTITGGLLGALVDYGVSPDDAQVYAENVRRGGTLVSVRAADERISDAEEIMQDYDPVDVGVRGNAYREEGWEKYDPDAPAYSSSDTQVERDRYRA